MKNIKKTLSLCLIIFSLFIFFPIHCEASDYKYQKTTDLVYFETVIEDNSHNIITLASTTKSKTGSKTIYCKDADGKVLWYVKVTGTFSYDGSTSTCTSVSMTTSTNAAGWNIVNKKCSKSGNRATASATGQKSHNGTVTNSITKSVTLSCSKTGTLS